MAKVDPQSAVPWDDRVVAEILEDGYTQAVVVTDRSGGVVAWHGRERSRASAGQRLDVLLAGLGHGGQELELGTLRLAAVLYSGGTLVTASDARYHFVLLAGPDANLGRLFSHARRLCAAAAGE